MAATEPALLLGSKKRTLVVADLHLGLERAFSARGVNLPSQTNRMLSRIESLVSDHKPTKLMILGDVKHGISKIAGWEWSEIPFFFEKLLKLVEEVEVVPGNHDGGLVSLLPRQVVLHGSEGVCVHVAGRKVGLVHGHAWPAPDLFSCSTVLMGHHHFSVEMMDNFGLRVAQQIWLVVRWNKDLLASAYLKAHGVKPGLNPVRSFRSRFGVTFSDGKVVVIPTFNRMISGWPVNSKMKEEFLGPVFRSEALKMNEAEVYLPEGTYLGLLKQLVDLKQFKRSVESTPLRSQEAS